MDWAAPAEDDSTPKQRQARGLRQAAESPVFELAIPLAAYRTLLGFGAGQWPAITLSSPAALSWLILGSVRNRRLDAMPVFALAPLLIAVGADAWICQWDHAPTFRRHLRLLTVGHGLHPGCPDPGRLRDDPADGRGSAVLRFRGSAIRRCGGLAGLVALVARRLRRWVAGTAASVVGSALCRWRQAGSAA
ncbi:hypothetical protein [Kitasatospora griseola]|uniref:hypothetical protein n=1 Tax=Kitasatospora griseola TaxID=2064 RepID=UPI00128E6F49|nr:hypothetical protein [Kitasatospora griseola]